MSSVVDSVAPWRGYICLENSALGLNPSQTNKRKKSNKNKSNNNKQTNHDSNGTIEKSEIAYLEK